MTEKNDDDKVSIAMTEKDADDNDTSNEFKDIGIFREGLAYASYDYKEYGYINHDGDMIIEAQYQKASSFYEGLAAVKSSENGKWGYIDKEGNWIIEPQYDFAEDFWKRTGKVLVKKGIREYYIDKEGNILEEVFN